MAFYLISFIAGLLTVLAPCVLPILPVVIGGSVAGKNAWRPLVITMSLGVSIVLFTLLLKVTTAFIAVPQIVWQSISGGIILFFGLVLLFPAAWEHISNALHFNTSSQQLLSKGLTRTDFLGAVILGAALGPVFASCSPTYFVILATVLPASFAAGLIDLIIYALGLALMLFLVAILGQKLVSKLGWAINPRGTFKKIVGILFIILGLAIVTGYEKKAEAWLLDKGFFDVTKIEQKLLEQNNGTPSSSTTEQSGASGFTLAEKEKRFMRAPEIAGLTNWINHEPIISLKDLRGKVVLIDFWTYSCINCIRTLPFIESWDQKYAKDGLVIIGVHAPEFQFEKKIENVQDAVKRFGITYAVAQDNDFETWHNYKNLYWPAHYLIDADGFIRDYHAGEGGYEETERHIQELLSELQNKPIEMQVTPMNKSDMPDTSSPETYFGAARNEFLGNGTAGATGTLDFKMPSEIKADTLYLDGTWDIQSEFTTSTSSTSKIIFKYTAKNVFFVASAGNPVTITVLRDGKPLGTVAGKDITSDSTATINEERLYDLIHDMTAGEHTIEIDVQQTGLRAFTFTFG